MARSIPWRVFTITLMVLLPLCIGGQSLTAQGEKNSRSPKTNVFVYPEKLTAQDKLVDGPGARAIEISSETTLIWVDLMPDYRFAHSTEYVLISTQGTRVIKGNWWPVLNGKALFRDKTYKVDFPVRLTGK